MYCVQVFSFLIVLLALGQCQRMTTTTTDAPWIWGEPSNNENPPIRTRPTPTRPSRPISTATPATDSATTVDPPQPRVCPGCARTPQFNPVCGSDNATYDNPQAVDCANMCGPKIEIVFYAACRPTA